MCQVNATQLSFFWIVAFLLPSKPVLCCTVSSRFTEHVYRHSILQIRSICCWRKSIPHTVFTHSSYRNIPVYMIIAVFSFSCTRRTPPVVEVSRHLGVSGLRLVTCAHPPAQNLSVNFFIAIKLFTRVNSPGKIGIFRVSSCSSCSLWMWPVSDNELRVDCCLHGGGLLRMWP